MATSKSRSSPEPICRKGAKSRTMKNSSALGNSFWLDRRWYQKGISRQQAEAFCRAVARHHYENFTVISFLLPRGLRQHFANVYAYCRVSDDLADELGDPHTSLDRLDEWREHLDHCYAGQAVHPVFVALQSTIERFDIPQAPFENLLKAFRQDQIQIRYSSWQGLLGYCENSANPVGRMVLYLCGHRDQERQALSDQTCTGLQLTNFWQDVTRDYERGRIYIPREILDAHGYSETMLANRVVNREWTQLMRDLIDRTRPFFYRGLRLCSLVLRRLRLDIELFSRGGLEILRTIEEIDYDTLHHRPQLTRGRETCLLLGALVRSLKNV